jgi:DNA-binding MarR family transcriptional regulator
MDDRDGYDHLLERIDQMVIARDQDVLQRRDEIARYANRVTGVEMSYTDLLILEQMKHDGTTRMAELAQAIGVTSTTMTRRIHSLENSSLVLRTPDGQDGRASVVKLSEKGQQVADLVGRTRFDILRGAMEDWSQEDAELLLALSGRLRADTRRVWMARYLEPVILGAETETPAPTGSPGRGVSSKRAPQRSSGGRRRRRKRGPSPIFAPRSAS